MDKEKTKGEKLSDIVFDNKKQPEPKKNTTPAGIKIVGIISLVSAVVGLVLMGLCIYFMIISPNYNKSNMKNSNVVYSDVASVMDSAYSEQKEALKMISTYMDATPMDGDMDLPSEQGGGNDE